PNQLMRVLGPADGAWATQLLGVTGAGTFERGFSTLQLQVDPDDAQRWTDVRAKLLVARAERTRPARDDKIVASWNGLAITALAEAGVLLDEPDFGAAALDAAELLSTVHLGERLIRTSRDGKASNHVGVLEDYAAVAEGVLAVLGLTGDAVWLDRAQRLLDRVVDHFADPAGGFFDTADDAETLVVRPKDASDNAYPSGTSAAVAALLSCAAITGDHRYRKAAESGIDSASSIATQVPRFAGWTLAAAEAVLAGPLEVAIVGPAAARADLHRAALGLTSPGAVVVAGDVGMAVPLFEQRGLVDGKPAAYVCRGFVCERPVTTVEELRGR
ncbi:MAG: N-acylglucosamine 2-epimerase, partial [Ilumatobacteraceae bacterium]|nr:N-acylglucosamine 2-epimerase [Ilumatobacteraceae bacterium]